MAYLDDLIAARAALLQRLITGPFSKGATSYSIDGEDYSVRHQQITQAIKDLTDLILREQNRVPGRRDLHVRRGTRWWAGYRGGW